MNKKDILKMRQQENKGKLDEREMAAFGKASRIGMLVGALLCVALILVSEFARTRFSRLVGIFCNARKQQCCFIYASENTLKADL